MSSLDADAADGDQQPITDQFNTSGEHHSRSEEDLNNEELVALGKQVREDLIQSDAFQTRMTDLWEVLDDVKDEFGALPKEGFYELNIRFQRALNPPQTDTEALEGAEEDWVRDSSGEATMSFQMFNRSITEVLLLWTPDLNITSIEDLFLELVDCISLVAPGGKRYWKCPENICRLARLERYRAKPKKKLAFGTKFQPKSNEIKALTEPAPRCADAKPSVEPDAKPSAEPDPNPKPIAVYEPYELYEPKVKPGFSMGSRVDEPKEPKEPEDAPQPFPVALVVDPGRRSSAGRRQSFSSLDVMDVCKPRAHKSVGNVGILPNYAPPKERAAADRKKRHSLHNGRAANPFVDTVPPAGLTKNGPATKLHSRKESIDTPAEPHIVANANARKNGPTAFLTDLDAASGNLVPEDAQWLHQTAAKWKARLLDASPDLISVSQARLPANLRWSPDPLPVRQAVQDQHRLASRELPSRHKVRGAARRRAHCPGPEWAKTLASAAHWRRQVTAVDHQAKLIAQLNTNCVVPPIHDGAGENDAELTNSGYKCRLEGAVPKAAMSAMELEIAALGAQLAANREYVSVPHSRGPRSLSAMGPLQLSARVETPGVSEIKRKNSNLGMLRDTSSTFPGMRPSSMISGRGGDSGIVLDDFNRFIVNQLESGDANLNPHATVPPIPD